MTGFDALIIGGGLHGCSVALHLARRGLKPATVEKNRCGRHPPGVHAGRARTRLPGAPGVPPGGPSRSPAVSGGGGVGAGDSSSTARRRAW